MRGRGAWSTRWGFYFAAVGSSFGLGNLWRFPYIVGTSGGGAFVLLYLFTAFLIALPLLVGELILGKTTRKSVVVAIGEVAPKSRLTWFGRLSLLASLLLLAYYAVVSGWVLHFLVQYSVGIINPGPMFYATAFRKLMSNGWLQVGLSSVHLLVCGLVVAKGIQQGIEKWVGYVMPVFGFMLLYLIYTSLSLPGTMEALRFLFYPDFSKLTTETWLRAIGHSLFTLSLGFGGMVVFGSYFRDDAKPAPAALRVMILNTLLSIGVGVLIFPIVFTGGLRLDSGPTLLFETLPVLLSKVGLGDIFGFLFFVCMYLAGFCASMGLLESGVAHVIDSRRLKRGEASLLIGALAFAVAILPALSSSVFAEVQIDGMTVLEALDNVLINFVLPISGLGIALIVGRRVKVKSLRTEFIFDDRESTYRLFLNWIFAIRWIVPISIGGALLVEILGRILLR